MAQGLRTSWQRDVLTWAWENLGIRLGTAQADWLFSEVGPDDDMKTIAVAVEDAARL